MNDVLKEKLNAAKEKAIAEKKKEVAKEISEKKISVKLKESVNTKSIDSQFPTAADAVAKYIRDIIKYPNKKKSQLLRNAIKDTKANKGAVMSLVSELGIGDNEE